MMGYESLENFFKTNFGLLQHHKWDLRTIEEMVPWEKGLYVDMLENFLKQKEREKALAEAEARKGR